MAEPKIPNPDDAARRAATAERIKARVDALAAKAVEGAKQPQDGDVTKQEVLRKVGDAMQELRAAKDGVLNSATTNKKISQKALEQLQKRVQDIYDKSYAKVAYQKVTRDHILILEEAKKNIQDEFDSVVALPRRPKKPEGTPGTDERMAFAAELKRQQGDLKKKLGEAVDLQALRSLKDKRAKIQYFDLTTEAMVLFLNVVEGRQRKAVFDEMKAIEASELTPAYQAREKELQEKANQEPIVPSVPDPQVVGKGKNAVGRRRKQEKKGGSSGSTTPVHQPSVSSDPVPVQAPSQDAAAQIKAQEEAAERERQALEAAKKKVLALATENAKKAWDKICARAKEGDTLILTSTGGAKKKYAFDGADFMSSSGQIFSEVLYIEKIIKGWETELQTGQKQQGADQTMADLVQEEEKVMQERGKRYQLPPEVSREETLIGFGQEVPEEKAADAPKAKADAPQATADAPQATADTPPDRVSTAHFEVQIGGTYRANNGVLRTISMKNIRGKDRYYETFETGEQTTYLNKARLDEMARKEEWVLVSGGLPTGENEPAHEPRAEDVNAEREAIERAAREGKFWSTPRDDETGTKETSPEKRSELDEKIDRLKEEVNDLRAKYVKEDYETMSAWVKLKNIFGRNVQEGEKKREWQIEYQNALLRLQEVELEKIKQSGVTGQELKDAMAELLRYTKLDEAVNLIGARTQYSAENRNWPTAILDTFGTLGREYNKLSFTKKMLIAGSLTGLALSMGLSGGAAGAAGIIVLRKILSGTSVAVALEAGLERHGDTRRESQANDEIESLLATSELSVKKQGGSPEAHFDNVEAFMKNDVMILDRKLQGEKRKKFWRKTGAIAVGGAIGSGWLTQIAMEKLGGNELLQAIQGHSRPVVGVTPSGVPPVGVSAEILPPTVPENIVNQAPPVPDIEAGVSEPVSTDGAVLLNPDLPADSIAETASAFSWELQPRVDDWYMQIFRTENPTLGQDWVFDKQKLLKIPIMDVYRDVTNHTMHTGMNMEQMNNLGQFMGEANKATGRNIMRELLTENRNATAEDFLRKVAPLVNRGQMLGLYSTTR